jgi:hypothetical protein
MPHRLPLFTNKPLNSINLPNNNTSNHTTNTKASIRAVVEDVAAVEDGDAAVMVEDISNRDAIINTVVSRIMEDMEPRNKDQEDSPW